MNNEYCGQKQVEVTIQENGIIRGSDGYIIGRLNDGIVYDSEHLIPVKIKEDIRKYKI